MNPAVGALRAVLGLVGPNQPHQGPLSIPFHGPTDPISAQAVVSCTLLNYAAGGPGPSPVPGLMFIEATCMPLLP